MSAQTRAELIESAIWLQEDACYLYQQASIYRDSGRNWLANQVQQNAAHSATLARAAVAEAATGGAS